MWILTTEYSWASNCWEECEQRKAKESAKRSGEKCVRLKLNCSAQLSSTANTLNWIRISSRAVDRCDIYISFHFNRLAGNRDRERVRACGKSYWNSKQTETWNNSNAIYYFKKPTNEFLLFALTVFLLHVCIRLRLFVCAVNAFLRRSLIGLCGFCHFNLNIVSLSLVLSKRSDSIQFHENWMSFYFLVSFRIDKIDTLQT